MKNSIESLSVRMHMLQMRDPVINANIIKKIKRRIRLLESS